MKTLCKKLGEAKQRARLLFTNKGEYATYVSAMK